MNDVIYIILKYAFIKNALLAGFFIAITASTLGVFLVLKRFSLIGDGLAHTTLFPIAFSIMLSLPPLLVAIPFVILVSILMLYLVEKGSLHHDTAIGLFSSTGIGLAIIIASFSKGFNVDLFSYLFGSILAVANYEVLISFLLAVTVCFFVIFMYKYLLSVTFDSDFAKTLGVNVKIINYLLIIFTSLTIVIGIKIVGTLLISTLIIFPAVTSLQISSSFKLTILLSIIIGISTVFIGIFLSILLNIPSGASIVVVNAFLFSFVFVINRIFKFK